MNKENEESGEILRTKMERTDEEHVVVSPNLCSSSSPSSCSSSSSSPSSSNSMFEVDTRRTSGSSSESGGSDPSNPSSIILDDTSQSQVNWGGEGGGTRSKGKEEEGTRIITEETLNSVSQDLLLLRLITQTESPGIQVMDKSAGYEEDKIPASIFARSKSTAPVDWSVASNESLFSIHMGGNTSFTKDRFMVSHEDLGKSGEFIIFSPSLTGMGRDEWLNCNEEEDDQDFDRKKMKKIKEDDEEDIYSHKTALSPTASWNSSSSPISVGATSRHSFAFPILIEGGGRGEGSVKVGNDERSASFSRGSYPSNNGGVHMGISCPAKPSWFSWFYSSCASCFICRPNCSRCFC